MAPTTVTQENRGKPRAASTVAIKALNPPPHPKNHSFQHVQCCVLLHGAESHTGKSSKTLRAEVYRSHRGSKSTSDPHKSILKHLPTPVNPYQTCTRQQKFTRSRFRVFDKLTKQRDFNEKKRGAEL
ncbi:protein phosphatase 2A 55 kDa regulatory subunit B alpha isoform [Striga asiatica]|uniref:Protein phosphatase 2A 55 kDa regulatory subunit B alpha isoform n=1 Tax=Striga asiatica TaxID=4170 RepID=A0A5A7PEP8_STRAF|nr:protein phosphatase 2A 55 kDa regulatory subunit B alpha isoform [Striga asiatica]